MPDPVALRPSAPAKVSLEQVAGWLGERVLEVRRPRGALLPVMVTGLTISSRRVCPGDLYVAPAGTHAHGATYTEAAVEDGAVAVLTDPAGVVLSEGAGVPVIVVERPRDVVGDLASRLYGRPSQRMRMVAVTGTQGKTTTTRLADAALGAAGVRSAVVGTVGTRVAGVEVETSLTTPEAPDLHALFAVMVEHGVQACVMEVSSHALVMGRVDGVVFDVACFTNLGRDHLDFHHDLEAYYAAKASLFTPGRARLGLVNVDDPHGRRLVQEASVPVRTFSPSGAVADWRAEDVRLEPTGSSFTVRAPSGEALRTRVPLTGEFNVANGLCAVAALAEAGFDAAAVASALGESDGVPGRLEQVHAGQDFLAVVDYAHKPDAVEAALSALRPLTRGRLVVVLGAGGDRDPGKRPLMGEIASRLADVLVITDDNPRSEDPAAIRAQLLAGARSAVGDAVELHEVGDRRAAIALAVHLARPGDTVVIAGKGHETGQEVAGTEHPFDDRVVLREELAAR